MKQLQAFRLGGGEVFDEYSAQRVKNQVFSSLKNVHFSSSGRALLDNFFIRKIRRPRTNSWGSDSTGDGMPTVLYSLNAGMFACDADQYSRIEIDQN